MKAYLSILPLMIILIGCSTESFEYPDIKDDFCGVEINYQYCKCAFHNDYCENIGMDKREARSYVESEYDDWTYELLNTWLMECELAGGIPGEDTCTYCDEGSVAKDGECTPSESFDEDEQQYIPDGPLNEDCTIKQDEFDKDWRKYSDIDDRIPYEERSYEAKQAVTAYDKMIEKMIEAFAIERDIEIEKKMQEELEEYRYKLVNNIKTNLLKAFWRLSWVTYTTVNSGTSLGQSYSEVLTSGASVATVGNGLKVIRGVIPKDSALAINTSSVTGKASVVGANVALEAMTSLDEPQKIATELFKSAAEAPLPSADISEEEINILREQHLQKGVIDEALTASRNLNKEREARLVVLEEEIEKLQDEIDRWEADEKERVKSSLEASCLELKEQYES